MSAPFVWIYVCVVAGILSAGFLFVSPVLLYAAVCASALSLRSKSFVPAFVCQCLLLFLLGQQLAWKQDRVYRMNPLLLHVRRQENETVRLTGIVLRTPEIGQDYFTLRMKTESIWDRPVSGILRLTVPGVPGEYPVVGDRIETFASLRLPRTYGIDGGFDYERYLRKEGIHALGSVKSVKLIRTDPGGFSIPRTFSGIRLRMILSIRAAIPGQEGALLRALWLDDRADLSPGLERSLMDAGIYHVIAISGFHVAVVLIIAFFLLRKIVEFPTAVGILCVILLGYFLLLEGRSSITRSFLLFLVFAFTSRRRENIRWSNSLPLCALLQLLMNPMDLYDSGYHLTYLATAAIVFIAFPLSRRIRISREIYRWFLDFVLTTLSIQFVLAPYQAYVFHRIPVSGLLANWIAVPLSSILIGFGFLALPYPAVMELLSPVLRPLLHVLVSASGMFESIWLFIVARPPFWLFLLFYALLLAAVSANRRVLRIGASVGACAALAFILTQERQPAGDLLRIQFIDVGQGDAILIEYPDGVCDLVDGGGFWREDALDIGTSVLLPHLTSNGITRLRRAFLTHAHADHMNGLISLLRYIPVDEMYVSRRPVGDNGFQRLMREVSVPIRSAFRGHEFRQGEVRVRVLMPEDSKYTDRVANDDSLVLLIEYQGTRVLLTGDIEREAELKLLRNNDLHADYVKVPHHGSRSSSSEELLNKLKMKTVFIMSGANNWFGHPAPEVVARYRKRHAMVYGTDPLGTITLSCRSGDCTVDAFRWSR